MNLFELEKFTYCYPGAKEPALKNVDLEIKENGVTVIAGSSGSGKTTLARVLTGLIPQYYGGQVSGKARYEGRPIDTWTSRHLGEEIGMLQQEADHQLVFSNVARELAFGMENLEVSPQKMATRLAEVVDFLGLQPLLHRRTETLSGGEKQKVALGGILAVHPRVLVLDEPLAQLDPVASDQSLQILQRLNHEWGLTIIIVEQSLERCFHMADSVVVMKDGRIVQVRTPPRIRFGEASRMKFALPATSRFFTQIFEEYGDKSIGVEADSFVPLSVREGRELLGSIAENRADFNYSVRTAPASPARRKPLAASQVEARSIWFSYGEGEHVIKNVSLGLSPGEMAAVVGGNGAGKSTLLQLLAGIHRSTRGRLQVDRWKNGEVQAEKMAGTVGFLSQNPNDYLWGKTVREEILFTPELLKKVDTSWISELMNALGLNAIKDRNPRQLSLGERMKVALAAVMACRPQILLLDEPTRALDSFSRQKLGKLLTRLRDEGAGIILATHDTEFVGEYADRVFLMHDGSLVSTGSTREIMGESMFYSSPARRLFRGVDEQVINWHDGLRWMESSRNDYRRVSS